MFSTKEEKRFQNNFQRLSDYTKVKVTQEDLY